MKIDTIEIEHLNEIKIQERIKPKESISLEIPQLNILVGIRFDDKKVVFKKFEDHTIFKLGENNVSLESIYPVIADNKEHSLFNMVFEFDKWLKQYGMKEFERLYNLKGEYELTRNINGDEKMEETSVITKILIERIEETSKRLNQLKSGLESIKDY